MAFLRGIFLQNFLEQLSIQISFLLRITSAIVSRWIRTDQVSGLLRSFETRLFPLSFFTIFLYHFLRLFDSRRLSSGFPRRIFPHKTLCNSAVPFEWLPSGNPLNGFECRAHHYGGQMNRDWFSRPILETDSLRTGIRTRIWLNGNQFTLRCSPNGLFIHGSRAIDFSPPPSEVLSVRCSE